MDLRADMVTQASDDVMANAEHSVVQQSVQRAVDKKTKDYQVKIVKLGQFKMFTVKTNFYSIHVTQSILPI